VKRQTVIFNNVLFDFDKAVLKPEGKAVVDQVVAEMKAHGSDTVVVNGHTCDLGSDEYNMGLGQRRADAVKSYMVENGIDAGRITSTSLGESQPAVPNDGAANRKLNRRAAFDITIVD
jgi:OOP family OmpA-OmpF porin